MLFPKKTISLITLFSIVGFAILIFATRWGIGASPDSVVYISGARSLVSGQGFSMLSNLGEYHPITHHAPLYSVLLSLPGFLSLDFELTSRIINALLFSSNILVFGLLISEFIGKKEADAWIIPVVGAAILLFSPVMVEIHIMAWTEGLFILLVLTGLRFLAVFIKKDQAVFLFFSAGAAAFAFLTRYAGLSLILTGILGIIIYLPGSIHKRVKSAALFSVMSMVPVLLWLVRNYLAAGTAANREFIFHPVSRAQVWLGVTTIAGWFGIPETASTLFKLIPVFSVVLVFMALFFLVNQSQRKLKNRTHLLDELQRHELVKFALLFVLVYTIFLFASISFFDANTPLDDRILSPIYVVSLLLGLFLAALLFTHIRNFQPVKIGSIVLSLAIIVIFSSSSINVISEGYRSGLGLNGLAWHQSETLKQLDQFPDEFLIFSNAPDAIILQTGRPAVSLPRKFESAAQRENVNYPSDMAAMKSEVDNNRALIVYFSILNRPNISTIEELRYDLGLEVLALLSDGTIFGSSKSAVLN
jgi:hypothetical protein